MLDLVWLGVLKPIMLTYRCPNRVARACVENQWSGFELLLARCTGSISNSRVRCVVVVRGGDTTTAYTMVPAVDLCGTLDLKMFLDVMWCRVVWVVVRSGKRAE
jgi:hypothetical protein